MSNGAPPSVAVIIATNDHSNLLGQSLAAIDAQDYDGEITTTVVFDQVEPDAALAVGAGSRRVEVVANNRAPGLSGARNTGLESAHGDVVALCGDDALWAPSKIRRQVEVLDAHPDVHFVGSGITVEQGGGHVDLVRDDSRVRFRDLLRGMLREAHHSTFLMRRGELIDKIGLIDEAVSDALCADYEWILRATRVTDLVMVPAALAVVNEHGPPANSDQWQTRIDGLRRIVDRYPEFETEPVGLARLLAQMAFAQASLGDRSGALEMAKRSLRMNPRQARAVLALGVAAGIPSVHVVGWLQKQGTLI